MHEIHGSFYGGKKERILVSGQLDVIYEVICPVFLIIILQQKVWFVRDFVDVAEQIRSASAKVILMNELV